jgi:photosystem II stability/assembly factor-like uncharacterized protein
MAPIHLYAATGDAVARLDGDDGARFTVTTSLDGSGAQCLTADPHDPRRLFVGTFDDGVYRTLDGGATWTQVGEAIAEKRVLSIAISPSHRTNGRSAVYAGTEPSQLYRSEDDGTTWQRFPRLPELPSAPTWSFPPRPWTSHVRWIAPHWTNPDLLFVGIELGGVMRSRDGGETWEDRKPGSYHDSHAILTHPTASDRVYEAAGEGTAVSTDVGDSWRPVDQGMDRHYVWGLAVDPVDPDCWYVSASFGARHAHRTTGGAEAIIYRRRGDAPWQPLGGNGDLPRPLPSMPYALLAPRDRPGTVIAGLKSGELLLSDDHGDSWRRLDVRLPSILALAEAPPNGLEQTSA